MEVSHVFEKHMEGCSICLTVRRYCYWYVWNRMSVLQNVGGFLHDSKLSPEMPSNLT